MVYNGFMSMNAKNEFFKGMQEADGKRIAMGCLAFLICVLLIVAIPFALLMIVFESFFRTFHFWMLVAGELGAFTLVYAWLARKRRAARIGAVLLLGALIAVSIHALWRWVGHDRFARISEDPYEVPYWRYAPFRKDNLLPLCDAPAEFRFRDGVPRLATAYALYPVAAAAVQALATREAFDKADRGWPGCIYNTGSDALFSTLSATNLLHRDAALSLRPSAEQMAEARQKGLNYELLPVARDAFVFFVHADNPATNLAAGQIRAIYSGRATSWRDVGVDFAARLMPFQRNKNSGSQTMLERIMGDEPIMPPMEEDRLGGMGEIFRDVAEYRNRRGALGFSFRYYATTLLAAGKVRLLAIDGVEPTVENIRSGAYPFVTDIYLTTVGSPTGDVARLASFLTSPAGRRLIEDIGYVAPETSK
jgi:phosphate transport system substrate-binding protein